MRFDDAVQSIVCSVIDAVLPRIVNRGCSVTTVILDTRQNLSAVNPRPGRIYRVFPVSIRAGVRVNPESELVAVVLICNLP